MLAVYCLAILFENVDYFVLQKDGKYGVIDKNANIVVEPNYENVVIPNPCVFGRKS